MTTAQKLRIKEKSEKDEKEEGDAQRIRRKVIPYLIGVYPYGSFQTGEEYEIVPYADACVVVGDEMVYAAYDTIVSMNLQPGGKRVLKTMEEGIGAYGMVENGGQNI